MRRVAAIGLFGLAMLTGGVAAQDVPALEDARIWKLEGNLVALSFTYPGGACDRTVAAEPGEAAEGKLPLTIPTVAVSEVCTMQIVQVPFSGVIELPEGVTVLSVTVASPQGATAAAGELDVPAE